MKKFLYTLLVVLLIAAATTAELVLGALFCPRSVER
jgi:hypothetical protein